MKALTYLKHIFYYPLVFIYGYLKSFFNKRKKMKDPVDFVVTWVDGNDKEWRAKRKKYEQKTDGNLPDNGEERYRNWEQLQYWFRAVECYAPWVHKVYLVISGHAPSWLNIDCEKLVVVNDQEFMDEKYLPTFNSLSIEHNLHRIKGLSEHFVYFNDDMIINSKLDPEDFFQDGLPLACSVGEPIIPTPQINTHFYHLFNAVGYMNRYNWAKIIESQPEKWFSHKYGAKLRYSWETYQHNYLTGILFTHMPQAFRKSTMEKVWNLFQVQLDITCRHKFRQAQDISHLVYTIQDIADGAYVPMNKTYYGFPYFNIPSNLDDLLDDISQCKSKVVCIEDSNLITSENFEKLKTSINRVFEEKFPQKSVFEK